MKLSEQATQQPFIFLDRDGTLVEEVNYGHKLEDYALIPGAIESLQRFRDAGFRLAIVTNQSGLGRGIFGIEDYEIFHGRLLSDLQEAGLEIVETYMCPHAPDKTCTCRKPLPTSLFHARDHHQADLAASWVIGDHVKDVETAANAGARGILLLTGHGEDEAGRLGTVPHDAVVADITAAANHILQT
jgi:D-glycero-D-manno-heptose 1,7-bisphosphate phosphatase